MCIVFDVQTRPLALQCGFSYSYVCWHVCCCVWVHFYQQRVGGVLSANGTNTQAHKHAMRAAHGNLHKIHTSRQPTPISPSAGSVFVFCVCFVFCCWKRKSALEATTNYEHDMLECCVLYTQTRTHAQTHYILCESETRFSYRCCWLADSAWFL